MLATRLEKMLAFAPGAPHNFGEFSPQMFRDWIEVLHGAGQLSTTEIPVESLYTNQFVKDFNQFDVAAVVREAKALK